MSPESEKIEVSGIYYHIGQICELCQCGFLPLAWRELECKYEFTNIKLVLRAVLPVWLELMEINQTGWSMTDPPCFFFCFYNLFSLSILIVKLKKAVEWIKTFEMTIVLSKIISSIIYQHFLDQLANEYSSLVHLISFSRWIDSWLCRFYNSPEWIHQA